MSDEVEMPSLTLGAVGDGNEVGNAKTTHRISPLPEKILTSPLATFRSHCSTPSGTNPKPQLPPGDPEGCNPVLLHLAPKDTHVGTSQDKFVIIMVGLPARGKTHIARRLARYMEFFHSCPTKQFNVGEYRRLMCGKRQLPEFFDHFNAEDMESRNKACAAALADLTSYMLEGDDCRVGFFDATNTTKERRLWVHSTIKKHGVKPIFLESICTDDDKIMKNILKVKVGSPDFKGIDSERAIAEFTKRIANYEKVYMPIDPDDTNEKDWMWIKMAQ